ncbi:MAG: amidohydrolase [Salinivirgaceae bacterium]|nr:amidohydrolase [Salinivirgaceae bacterium]
MWNKNEKTIYNATIITMNSNMELIENGFITITQNKITNIGIGKPSHQTNLIDAKGKIIIPGFINAHTHLPMTNFRGLADDLPLKEWLEDHIWPAEAKNNNAEYVRKGARLGLQEMINTGTTTFSDMYFFADVVAQETEKAGLRGVMNEAILELPTNSYQTPDEALEMAEAFIQKWQGNSLIIPNLVFHATYTCSLNTIEKIKHLSDKYNINVTTHILETQTENNDVIAYQNMDAVDVLIETGLFNKKLYAAHCVWLNKKEQKFFAENKVSIVHCPSSNLKLGSGIAPIPLYLEQGINVALGTDGCASNNNLDMVEEMRLAALIHKGVNHNPELIPAKEALKMATINGAKALGLEDKIGSLEIGKLADFLIIDTNNTFMQPIYDYYSAIVYSMNSSCIETVVVDGKNLIKKKKL